MKSLRSRSSGVPSAGDQSPVNLRQPRAASLRNRQGGDGTSTPKNSRSSSVTRKLSSAGMGNKNKRRSKFYNKHCVEKPTELFRTDLISEMKVADLEQLNAQHALVKFTDSWHRDWNTGVQVPVYDYDEGNGELPEKVDALKFSKNKQTQFFPAELPIPVFNEVEDDGVDEPAHTRLLRRKTKEDSSPKSDFPSTIGRHPVQYELDDLDARWLGLINVSLSNNVYPRFTLTENQLEKSIERLEIVYALRCADEHQSAALHFQQSDSNAVCDICRGEFSEEGNLLVFCDRCNVCVHQACYGIRRVPVGAWVCRPCSQDVLPSCILCPNRGGAFKPTKSGNKWAHVSCAVWIPEIEFGNPLLKEPITKINQVPEDRWTLECEICHQRNGACIQCSLRSCLVSYHVTCAQRAGWKVTYKESADTSGDVLDNFCKKHGKNWPPESLNENAADDNFGHSERQPQAGVGSIAYRVLVGLSYCDLENVFDSLREIPIAFRRSIFYYWRAKRLSAPDRVLIFDIDECQIAVERDRIAEFACRQLDFLAHLRRTMEKTRTMCYMIEHREKVKRQWVDTAADQFRLLSSISESGGLQMENGLKMKEFVDTFSLQYQPSAWLPQQEKIAELYSMFQLPPPPPTANPLSQPPGLLITPVPLASVVRKRGRPPQKPRVTGSPLAVVNSSAPKRISTPAQLKSKPNTPGRKLNGLGRRVLSSDSQYADDDEDTSIAQNVKRKRTPRVKYTP